MLNNFRLAVNHYQSWIAEMERGVQESKQYDKWYYQCEAVSALATVRFVYANDVKIIGREDTGAIPFVINRSIQMLTRRPERLEEYINVTVLDAIKTYDDEVERMALLAYHMDITMAIKEELEGQGIDVL